MRALIVEDDNKLAEATAGLLRSKLKLSVDIACDTQGGRSKFLINDYDLVILDWMLGDKAEIELCREFRAFKSKVAILILTVRSSISDKLAGFASGADDYLARPFQSAELVARIKAIIRRRYIPDNRPEIRIGHLVVDIARTRALWHGKLLELSPKEYALLEYLALHSNRAVTRQEIMEHVWDENADMFTNTVDVHIRYLRSKLGKGAVLIRTVKGKGYLLCAD